MAIVVAGSGVVVVMGGASLVSGRFSGGQHNTCASFRVEHMTSVGSKVVANALAVSHVAPSSVGSS